MSVCPVICTTVTQTLTALIQLDHLTVHVILDSGEAELIVLMVSPLVSVRQKLYYRALVPQIIWQLRFPNQTFIESRQIEFMGKTRTWTNRKTKGKRLQGYKSWPRSWHIQHQKRGYKGQRAIQDKDRNKKGNVNKRSWVTTTNTNNVLFHSRSLLKLYSSSCLHSLP